MALDFGTFSLHPDIHQALREQGFSTPTPVQQSTIPLALDGRDLIAQAETGSGKTLAFGLPMLSRLEPGRGVRALVVGPTRELVIQIREALAPFAARRGLRVEALFGGVGLGGQEATLRRGVDVVVGTPGRLKDLLLRGSLALGQVEILVLDEADRMLDAGFRRDIAWLMERLPSHRQTLVFSATMPADIEVLARSSMRAPQVVKLVQSQLSPTEIRHQFVRVAREGRLPALVALIERERPQAAVIFTQMKHETKRLAQKLGGQLGVAVGFLNGNMSQNARNQTLDRFRQGEIHLLVATDVAARGLDIEGLSHVFQYGLPTVVETYVHRSGRTGRNGQSGTAISLVTTDDEPALRALRKVIKTTELELALPEPAPAPEPVASPRAAAADPVRTRLSSRRPDVGRSTWRRFKLKLRVGHTETAESLRRRLHRQTGLEGRALGGIAIFPDHALVEVAKEHGDRFHRLLKSGS